MSAKATRPLRIAMLTYSVKPRGGVVHALEVSEALARRGHHVELFALARPGESLFRPTTLSVNVVRHVPDESVPFDVRIERMLETYGEGLAGMLPGGGFDLVHAQDCLSANAAIEVRDRGGIAAVLRTVHHVDDFRSPSLIDCQQRSIVGPDGVLVVAAPWARRLTEEFGVEAEVVRNGVDRRRFRPAADAAERERLRAGLDFGRRFVVLTVGGIEPRKGSLALLDGFAHLRAAMPELDPLLVIAGGTTLFDYRDEVERFDARARALGVERDVRVLGPQTDEQIEHLYRAADLFAFPSVKEGFGLAALEALAAELPVVASDLDVFRTFLADGESALLAPAGNGAALGRAFARVAGDGALRDRLRAGGRAVAASWSWDVAARSHERAYADFLARRQQAAA